MDGYRHWRVFGAGRRTAEWADSLPDGWNAGDRDEAARHAERGESLVVRDNWQGSGYRLYWSDGRYCVQVDGEISGVVYRTIREARDAGLARFGEVAARSFD